MAVSDAQKRAANKYIKEHMSTLACKVRKEQAAAFRTYCETRGMTSNTAIKAYVMSCLEDGGLAAQEAVGTPTRDGAISLPPETLETAQEAAGATGEVVPDFIARAVKTQAQRDKIARRCGINPAAPMGQRTEE